MGASLSRVVALGQMQAPLLCSPFFRVKPVFPIRAQSSRRTSGSMQAIAPLGRMSGGLLAGRDVSHVIRLSASDGHEGCDASNGGRTPARPAWNVWNASLLFSTLPSVTCHAGRAGASPPSAASHPRLLSEIHGRNQRKAPRGRATPDAPECVHYLRRRTRQGHRLR